MFLREGFNIKQALQNFREQHLQIVMELDGLACMVLASLCNCMHAMPWANLGNYMQALSRLKKASGKACERESLVNLSKGLSINHVTFLSPSSMCLQDLNFYPLPMQTGSFDLWMRMEQNLPLYRKHTFLFSVIYSFLNIFNRQQQILFRKFYQFR